MADVKASDQSKLDPSKSGMYQQQVPQLGQMTTPELGPQINDMLNQYPTYMTQDLSEKNPLPWQKYLDPSATGIADSILGDATNPRSPSTIQGFQNGIPTGITPGHDTGNNAITNNLLNGVGGDSVNFNSSVGSTPMSQAISRKYQNQANSKIQGLRNQIQSNAPMDQSKELNRASDIYGKQQQIRMQNFKEQYSFQQQRQQLYSQWQTAQGNATASFIGTVIGAIGMAAAVASDERLKKNISTGNDSVQEFLDGYKAWEYEYKNPAYGPGRYVSPMAQELEKTELGKSLVVNTPQGKMVDYQRGLGTVLAALAQINERLSKLERK